MTEIKKQRRIGQILLICKIIQLENEDMRTVSKIHVSDLQKWLEKDEEYVATLINVCASFDKRNIADDVLNNAHMYDDFKKRYSYRSALLLFWKQFLDYKLEKENEISLKKEIGVFLCDNKSYQLSEDVILSLLESFSKELILRIHELASTDMSALDVVLEMANMNMYSENEYFTLRELFLDIKEGDANKALE